MVWTRKSGTILKRGHNVWQIRWEVRGPDGKRKRPARTILGSYREADRELRRVRAATDNGLTPQNSKVTVAKYLDWWFQTDVIPDVRPRTSERYGSDVRLHISPVIGGIRLDHLQAADAAAPGDPVDFGDGGGNVMVGDGCQPGETVGMGIAEIGQPFVVDAGQFDGGFGVVQPLAGAQDAEQHLRLDSVPVLVLDPQVGIGQPADALLAVLIQSLGGHAVEIRRFDVWMPVTSQVSVTEIVEEDDHEVRTADP